MATYSQYATGGFGSDTIDESYNGIEGAFRLIEENSNNEYAIFEHVIGQDFAEAMAKNGAISESSYESILEAEASGLWGRFVEFIEKIKQKILGILRNFKNRIQMIFIKDGKELVSKYDKLILKKLNSDQLSKMKFKYAPFKNTTITKDAELKNGFMSAIADTDMNKKLKAQTSSNGVLEILKGAVDRDDSSKNDYYKSKFDKNDDYGKPYTEDEKESFKDEVLTALNGGKSTDSKSFMEDFLDNAFDDEDEKEGLDGTLYATIKARLKDSSGVLHTIDKEERDAKRYYEDLKKDIQKIQKVFDKATEANTYTARYGSRVVTRATTLCNIGSSCVTTAFAAYSAAIKKDLKQCRAIFTKAVTYNQKKSANEQASLLEAVVEVSNYEIDEMFA